MHLLVVMEAVKGRRRKDRHCSGHELSHDTHGTAYQPWWQHLQG